MFQEVMTRSPRLYHVRHTLLPVFLVSGLGVQSLQPLLRQLAYPAFVAALPTTPQHSVEEYAELLMLVTRSILTVKTLCIHTFKIINILSKLNIVEHLTALYGETDNVSKCCSPFCSSAIIHNSFARIKQHTVNSFWNQALYAH